MKKHTLLPAAIYKQQSSAISFSLPSLFNQLIAIYFLLPFSCMLLKTKWHLSAVTLPWNMNVCFHNASICMPVFKLTHRHSLLLHAIAAEKKNTNFNFEFTFCSVKMRMKIKMKMKRKFSQKIIQNFNTVFLVTLSHFNCVLAHTSTHLCLDINSVRSERSRNAMKTL